MSRSLLALGRMLVPYRTAHWVNFSSSAPGDANPSDNNAKHNQRLSFQDDLKVGSTPEFSNLLILYVYE
jgi:hypothetical protein